MEVFWFVNLREKTQQQELVVAGSTKWITTELKVMNQETLNQLVSFSNIVEHNVQWLNREMLEIIKMGDEKRSDNNQIKNGPSTEKQKVKVFCDVEKYSPNPEDRKIESKDILKNKDPNTIVKPIIESEAKENNIRENAESRCLKALGAAINTAGISKTQRLIKEDPLIKAKIKEAEEKVDLESGSLSFNSSFGSKPEIKKKLSASRSDCKSSLFPRGNFQEHISSESILKRHAKIMKAKSLDDSPSLREVSWTAQENSKKKDIDQGNCKNFRETKVKNLSTNDILDIEKSNKAQCHNNKVEEVNANTRSKALKTEQMVNEYEKKLYICSSQRMKKSDIEANRKNTSCTENLLNKNEKRCTLKPLKRISLMKSAKLRLGKIDSTFDTRVSISLNQSSFSKIPTFKNSALRKPRTCKGSAMPWNRTISTPDIETISLGKGAFKNKNKCSNMNDRMRNIGSTKFSKISIDTIKPSSPKPIMFGIRKKSLQAPIDATLPELQGSDDDLLTKDIQSEWCKSPIVKQTLLRQQEIDPESIFGTISALNMSEIFSKYH
ncbi:hypothetical protein DASC09_049580 [Saccharomycopsis crataegensis]|uniref:Inner centromere protein ARK-binding domain-containing protein n=1 Tax=Saccharomycopsis crataegensis TaxID=43959 RepID=A0AAV5QU23_9ASCO|nr:hypothetical protein DASC09_049580 [Saccharomycopsis crataegensis]